MNSILLSFKAYDKAFFSIVFDGSSKLSTTDKTDVKAFIKNLLNEYTINANHSANILQYYEDGYTEATCLDIKDQSSANTLDSYVEGIIIAGVGTSITKGLTLAQNEIVVAECLGTEADRKKVVFLIAASEDEPSISTPKTLLGEANALKALGVEIYAIGMNNANQTALGLVTGDPKRVTMLSTYSELVAEDLAVTVNRLLEIEGLILT